MSNLKETTELVDGLLSIVELVQKADADGKIDLMDLPLVLGVIPVISPALDGAKLVPGELSHLEVADAEALVAHVMAKLSVANEKAKEVIHEALATGVQVAKLVKAVKA